MLSQKVSMVIKVRPSFVQVCKVIFFMKEERAHYEGNHWIVHNKMVEAIRDFRGFKEDVISYSNLEGHVILMILLV